MSERYKLIEELRIIDGSWEQNLTPAKKRRAKEIRRMIDKAICRNCKKEYNTSTARGDYTGFCSAKCQHEKAKNLGYRKGKGRSEYEVLKESKEIGNVWVI